MRFVRMVSGSKPDLLASKPNNEGGQDSTWTVSDSILAYGVRIGLRTNNEETLAQLLTYLPPLWQTNSYSSVDRIFSLWIGKSVHTLFEDSVVLMKSRSLRQLLEGFAIRVKAYVAEMARGRVFVHAGAVAWNGTIIIMPGRSMSGKTSLVRELICAGAEYYSDEYAVLDRRGFVQPYPQPLAIRKSGSYVQHNYRVEELGGIVGTKTLPIGMVIVSRYRQNAHWRPRRLTTGQGVLELLNNTIPARRKPAVVMATLQRAISDATVLKSPRGDTAEVIDFIFKAANRNAG